VTHPLTATRNDYADGGEVQFYATALGIVAAENRFTRTGELPSSRLGPPKTVLAAPGIFTVVKHLLL
jgi:hypothetical protein